MSGEQTRAGPWYGFLYRLLGAHGTFWLWVVSVVAMWATGGGALVRLLDREPEHHTVAEVAASGGSRWVSLYGVELWLDGALLARDGSGPEFSPEPVLVDAGDPAARFWVRVKILADIDAGLRAPGLEPAAALLGDTSAVVPQALRAHEHALDVQGKLIEASTALRTNVKVGLPRPGGAILLLKSVAPEELPAAIGSGTGPSLVAPSPRPSAVSSGDENEIDLVVRSVTEWAEKARTRVRVSFPAGLLDSAPKTLLERLEKEPGVQLAPSALLVDRRPSDAKLYVFCAAALFMVFLAAGFYGAARPRAGREPGSPPPSP